MSRERLGRGRGRPRGFCTPSCVPLATFCRHSQQVMNYASRRKRGTGAVVHGDGMGCSSRRPAELRDSHMRRVEMSISVTIQHRKAGRVGLNAVSVGSLSRILVAAPLTGLDMLSNQTCASSFVPQGEIWSQLDIAPSRYLSSGYTRPPLQANTAFKLPQRKAGGRPASPRLFCPSVTLGAR